jgi:tetratricopeptide (TPR) repeat protein
MTLWQARRTLTISPKNENVAGGIYRPIRFSPDSFEYDYSYESKGKWLSETIRVDLVTAPVVKAKCGNSCKITDESGKSNPKNINPGLGRFLANLQWCDTGAKDQHLWVTTCQSADCQHAAESFAAAFNVLRAFAIDTNSPLRNFAQRAAAWRALATKPPIPEEVNVQRLMAEDAIKENKPDEALNYYEDGIELYPTWPEGNFNAALIAAEQKYYADAIEHMQAYLELVPNAADAQAAHEKILIWQVKSKQ